MAAVSQARIARAREAFFAEGRIDPNIRPEIIMSWRRSAQLGLSPDRALPPTFVSPDRSVGLRRASEPVVAQLLRDIGERSAAMLLLNTEGVVVGRWSGSPRINRVLNGFAVEPGRVFDEASAGTTGLGTPLENGRSTVIEGAEHVLAALDTLTAVGTPIVHPARGTVEGVIDIVGTVGVETSMMLPLVRQAARDIGERLVSGYAAEDRCLLDAFLSAERRGPRRPVLAINERLIIGNGPGNALGLASEHAELWRQVQHAISAETATMTVRLPTGECLRSRVQPVGGSSLVGALIQISGAMCRAEADDSHAGALLESRQGNESVFDVLERDAIRDALANAQGNRRAAAQLLGISRATLYRKMTRHGIPG